MEHSLSTFNKSINAVLTENLGYNLTPSVNINISGEQQYRNRSFNSSIYLGAEYRFPVYRDFQIPLGSIMGFKHLHIDLSVTLLRYGALPAGFIIRFGKGYSLGHL